MHCGYFPNLHITLNFLTCGGAANFVNKNKTLKLNIKTWNYNADFFSTIHAEFSLFLKRHYFLHSSILLFCQSQLLNSANTLRDCVTGVKVIMECLWSAEKFFLFLLFLILCCENFLRHSCKISMLMTYFTMKSFKLVILLKTLILFASSFTPKAFFHSAE